RAMFGGWGVYLDGVIVGIIAWDTFYLKADDATRPRFAAAGSSPFSYETRTGRNTMNGYWECPADVLEDPDALRDWARAAQAVARRAKPPAKPRQRSRRS
ncbi:MAG: TfoX/Sxy family protein, partial [Dongiaceae bacterium]